VQICGRSPAYAGLLFSRRLRQLILYGVRAHALILFRERPARLKTFLQILVAVILHPIALILMILNLIGREDLDGGKKILWAIIGLLWGLGPILYIAVGDGALW